MSVTKSWMTLNVAVYSHNGLSRPIAPLELTEAGQSLSPFLGVGREAPGAGHRKADLGLFLRLLGLPGHEPGSQRYEHPLAFRQREAE